MQPTATRATTSGGDPTGHLRDAFRDLHGTRLHAFALLVTLGDGARAARLAAQALESGAAAAADLRHPERAAAWLRARVVREDRRRRRSPVRTASARLAALSGLDVDQQTFAALSSLRHLERAALVAAVIERLDIRDVATIVGRGGGRLDALLRDARRRYLAGYAGDSTELGPASGPITKTIRDVATRAMA